jgi:hypothetical protein
MQENALFSLSILIKDIKKIATRLLAAFISWFQHLHAQHQQIQEQLTSIQRWNTRKQIILGKNPCLIEI